MKKSFITSLLIFSIACNSIVCFASDDFDYGINETVVESFNNTVRYEDSEGNLLNITTYDFVPLLNKSITVPAKKSVSALIRSFCNMCSGGYDLTKAILATFCDDNSNYSFTITAENESLTTDSKNGNVLISGIPEGEFSAYINNISIVNFM